MKLSHTFLFLSITKFGILTHASPDSRVKGVSMGSSLTELPLTRSFHSLVGSRFAGEGGLASLAEGGTARSAVVAATISSGTAIRPEMVTVAELGELGVFSPMAKSATGVKIWASIPVKIGEIGLVDWFTAEGGSGADFLGDDEFDVEGADPVGERPGEAFLGGFFLTMRAGGCRRRDRRRWRKKEEDRSFERETRDKLEKHSPSPSKYVHVLKYTLFFAWKVRR